MIRRLIQGVRLDIIAAYAARLALALVGVVLSPLPRRNKVTLLTRQSSRPPSDFILLSQALTRADPSLDVVIVAKMVPPGIVRKVAYAAHLVTEMYHAQTSRVLVVDGYSIIASAARHSEGLMIVQVWHALGSLKKFGLSILGQPGGRDPKLAKAMRMHAGYDLVIASAERCRAPFADAFGVSVDKVVAAPLPRVDRLVDPEQKLKARATFDHLYPQLAGQRIAVFAPTFRTEGLTEAVDPVELTLALEEAGYATITKLHPLLPAPRHPKLRTAPGMSTQEMLLVADIFITDYSSAVFEAAVAGVPSYLIAPDLDQYSAKRDFYVRYPDALGLPLAMDVTELVTQVHADAGSTADATRLRDDWVQMPEQGLAADALARIILEWDDARARRKERP
ncbi:CDP-glycerol glycerophosphotransferase (TagB/SpsB family) [Microbacterium phyllosphaerae]|uniref:CDP-glycerol glycerophosphotransferase (TagB/SpsB family) n=1 Tax=Microbacterium phyllosphaerae TaxID=124798 RepID=A0ABS4WKK8_9MICO|nr:CDP-glycerol glycerophosphotransferase family protein [Microbacterium phyllosphaerae]MBP2376722.1 CDP-glycerol glycerophosphotransferase (TagB/SpsB family) [Microbacterium phyllosphaerae]